MKRFLVCSADRPIEGDFGDYRSQLVEPDGFDTKDAALQFISVFPGKGFGYIYDTIEQRGVHLFSWERTAPAN